MRILKGHRAFAQMVWHIPSDNEFKTLEIFEGLTQDQADMTG